MMQLKKRWQKENNRITSDKLLSNDWRVADFFAEKYIN